MLCDDETIPSSYQESLIRISRLEEQLRVQKALLMRRDQELTKACNLLEVLQLEIETFAELQTRTKKELIESQFALDEFKHVKGCVDSQAQSLGKDSWEFQNYEPSEFDSDLLCRSLSCISTMDEKARTSCKYVARLEQDLSFQKLPSETVKLVVELLRNELSLMKLERFKISNLILARSPAAALPTQTLGGNDLSIAMHRLLHPDCDPAQHSPRPSSSQQDARSLSNRLNAMSTSLDSQVSVLHSTLYEAYARFIRRGAEPAPRR
jgi:hypothetical protein